MVSIKVVWRDSGKPAKDQKVAIGINSFLSGGVTKGQYTNSDGEAHFDIDPCEGQVFINGSTKHEGTIKGRVVIYI